MGIFREIKRVVSQFFETEYWYRFRKISRFSYDAESDTFIRNRWPIKARDILTSTWDGEYDIMQMMLMKVEHMFWNLHKHGVECKYYIYSDIFDKYATKTDRELVVAKALREAFADYDMQDIFLFNGEVNKKISDSGIVHFYLRYDMKQKQMQIVAITDEQIPPESIPKHKKMYELDTIRDEDGKLKLSHKEAPAYKNKKEEIIWTCPNSLSSAEVGEFDIEKARNFFKVTGIKNFEPFISGYVEKNNVKVDDDSKEMLKDATRFVIRHIDPVEFSIEELPKLSKQLKEHARGNFVKCRDLLKLRRLIGKCLNISSTDDKYTKMWDEADDNRRAAMKKAFDLYHKDRKAAYKAVFDLICDKGEEWWD